MVSLELFWPTPLVMTLVYAAASSPEAAVTRLVDYPLTAPLLTPGGRNAAPDAAAFAGNFYVYGAEFRKKVKRQLAFVFLVARPSAAQRSGILEDVERAMLTLFREQYSTRRIGNQLHVLLNKTQINPLLKSEEFWRVIKPHLTDDQWAAVERELEEQQRFSRSAAVRLFVSHLSDHLYLSTEQQQALVTRLEDKWGDQWTSVTLMLVRGNFEYVPNIPDVLIIDIFTENQKQVWRNFSKLNGVFLGDFIGEINVPKEIWEFQVPD